MTRAVKRRRRRRRAAAADGGASRWRGGGLDAAGGHGRGRGQHFLVDVADVTPQRDAISASQ